MTDSIVFVCNDNTTVSPMAEAIFKNLSSDSGISAVSRGTVVLFSEPVNPKISTVMENHNLTFEHIRSVQLIADDVTDSTLVLTMSDKLKKQVKEIVPQARFLYTLKEYCGETGDVKDPYGGTLVDYEDCYSEIVRLIKKTIYRLDEERHTESKALAVAKENLESYEEGEKDEDSNRQ